MDLFGASHHQTGAAKAEPTAAVAPTVTATAAITPRASRSTRLFLRRVARNCITILIIVIDFYYKAEL